MKKFLLLALTLFCLGGTMEAQAQNQRQETKKTLIAYFSYSGNTRKIAQQIQQKTGADLFEIEVVKPYSSDYDACVKEAQRDQKANARPALKTKVENMAQYDVILLGYPNWWYSIPMPVATFLEGYDLAGKTIIPFCSHGGGGLSQSVSAIAKLAPRSKIGKPLSVSSSGGSSLPNDISAWLNSNSISQKDRK
jgi:flavodoxin